MPEPKILATLTMSVPGPRSPLRRTDITIVLVERTVNDYAAYIGADRDPQWVRRFGNKMTFQEACNFSRRWRWSLSATESEPIA